MSARGAGQADIGIAFSLPPVHEKGHNFGVDITPSVLSELIVTAPGPLHRKESVSLSHPGISWGGPVTLHALIKNEGTVYYLNNKLRANTSDGAIPLPGVLILPESARDISFRYTGAGPCLPCKASVTVNGTTAMATVWIVPVVPMIIGAVVVALGLPGSLIICMRRRHGRNHRAEGARLKAT